MIPTCIRWGIFEKPPGGAAFSFFKSASVCGFGAAPLEGVRGDELGDLLDVGGAGELEDYGAQTGEHQLQLAVQVEVAGGLDGEGLDLAVGQGSEVLLFAGETLDVDGDHPLVGEYYIVPHGGVGAHHLLPGSKKLQNVLLLGILVQAELDDGFVREVDHGDSPLGFKIEFSKSDNVVGFG